MKSRPHLQSPNRHGVARVLSKLGFCSRAEAARLIRAGRVTLDGSICRNPEQPAIPGQSSIRVDGRVAGPAESVYLMLNKPRGLVTTAADERGRGTVFTCLESPAFGSVNPPKLPRHLSAVGRLDQASEGLLLFTNDSIWAAHLTDPRSRLSKIYHVQINGVADPSICRQLEAGASCDGEHLAVDRATILRTGKRNSWMELTLHEGRNRHLRRLLNAVGFEVLRLLRIQIGGLTLGVLPKGKWRFLSAAEVSQVTA